MNIIEAAWRMGNMSTSFLHELDFSSLDLVLSELDEVNENFNWDDDSTLLLVRGLWEEGRWSTLHTKFSPDSAIGKAMEQISNGGRVWIISREARYY